MDRICPNCHVKLGSYDHYFCTACGTELPKELISTQGVYKHVANFGVASPTASKKKTEPQAPSVPVKDLVSVRKMGLTIIGLGVVLMGIFYLAGPIQEFVANRAKAPIAITDLPKMSATKKTKSMVSSPLGWEAGDFGADNLYAAVPYDADIVIEGHDLFNFASFYKSVDPAYSDLIDLTVDKVGKNFVFFAHRENEVYHWTLVFVPLDNSLTLAPDTLKQYDWLKFWKSDPIAVFATHSDVIQSIQDAKTNVSKNFTHTTLYASSRQSIPPTEKMVIFVKNDAARQHLQTLLAINGLPDEVKAIIEEIVGSQSEYSVVQ
jgi:hypothetical protein